MIDCLITFSDITLPLFRWEIWACCLCSSSSFMRHLVWSFLGN